jgi:hypothetical protein
VVFEVDTSSTVIWQPYSPRRKSIEFKMEAERSNPHPSRSSQHDSHGWSLKNLRVAPIKADKGKEWAARRVFCLAILLCLLISLQIDKHLAAPKTRITLGIIFFPSWTRGLKAASRSRFLVFSTLKSASPRFIRWLLSTTELIGTCFFDLAQIWNRKGCLVGPDCRTR